MVLAACIAAALVFRRFAYVAWYPVLMSAAVSGGFAFSLLGRESLCLALARKIPPHVLPEGAERYCRAYTALWAAWLAVNGLIACATIYAPGPVWHLERAGLDVPCVWVVWNCCLSYCATGLIVLAALPYRRRPLAATLHTPLRRCRRTAGQPRESPELRNTPVTSDSLRLPAPAPPGKLISIVLSFVSCNFILNVFSRKHAANLHPAPGGTRRGTGFWHGKCL